MRKVLSTLLAVIIAAALIPGPAASALTSLDRYYTYQWALKNNGSFSAKPGNPSAAKSVAGIDIDVETAWDTYTSGRQVVIALIDTGVDVGNADLAGHLWVNKGEISGNGLDDDGNGYIDDVNGWNFRDSSSVLHVTGEDDHGTHCCGTMVASCNDVGIAGICGYTENVKVMVLKAFSGSNATGKTSDIIRAIRYAEDNGASIVNLSLGIDQYNEPLYQAMKSSKMLFVCAAGNSGANSDVTPMYPAAYDLGNIISVANLSYDGTLNASSNYGSTVDIAAPGTSIIGYGAEGGMYYMTGTSMAAPMVTAAAALVYLLPKSHPLGGQGHSSFLSSAAFHPRRQGCHRGMLDVGAALTQGAKLAAAKRSSFKDVKTTDWFYKYVTELAATGYVAGYEDGTFHPSSSVTIGEALALILTATGNGSQLASDGHWASGYRDKALELGIAEASDMTDLNAQATRMFIGRTTAKALKLSPADAVSPFTDVNDSYITALYTAGYVTGSLDSGGNRVFLPESGIKRSEISTIVWHITF